MSLVVASLSAICPIVTPNGVHTRHPAEACHQDAAHRAIFKATATADGIAGEA